jgi:hypothetical protein
MAWHVVYINNQILRKDLQFQRKENTWQYEPAGELKSISRGFVSLIRGLLSKFIPTYTVGFVCQLEI